MRLRTLRSVLFLAGFSILCAAFSAAVEPPIHRSGDYVFYRDHTWKSPTWIGFMRYDAQTWGAVLVTPEFSGRVSVLFRAEELDGQLVLTGQNIISSITQDDVPAVNYLMNMLPDMYSWRLAAARQAGGDLFPQQSGALLPADGEYRMIREEFGGPVRLRYSAWIPLFNLQGMYSPSGSALLELERAGRIQNGDEEAFYGFIPVPETLSVTGAPAISASGAREDRLVDGFTLKLDGNWTMIADNAYFLGDTAMLVVDTLSYRERGLEAARLSLELTRLFSLSGNMVWIRPDSLEVSGSASRFTISNLVYDPESGRWNRDIKLVVPGAEGTCRIISLAVNETVYQVNRAYFDSLF